MRKVQLLNNYYYHQKMKSPWAKIEEFRPGCWFRDIKLTTSASRVFQMSQRDRIQFATINEDITVKNCISFF